MHASILKSPLFWASFVFFTAFLFHKFRSGSAPNQPNANPWHQLATNSPIDHGWFIKPFITPNGDTGIALDGGEIPLLDYQFPALTLGGDSLDLLHLVFLHDWNSQKSRQMLGAICSLALADTDDAIPTLNLVLLPVSSSPDSKEIDQMLLWVNSMSARIETLPDLIRLLCDPAQNPSVELIRSFLAEAEPDLLERIDATPQASDHPVHPAFAAAETQIRRNASLLALPNVPQLVAMNQILTVLPVQENLLSFLASSFSYQQTFLASPEGQIPISPSFGCRCKIASHHHESWKSAVFRHFPELLESQE